MLSQNYHHYVIVQSFSADTGSSRVGICLNENRKVMNLESATALGISFEYIAMQCPDGQ